MRHSKAMKAAVLVIYFLVVTTDGFLAVSKANSIGMRRGLELSMPRTTVGSSSPPVTEAATKDVPETTRSKVRSKVTNAVSKARAAPFAFAIAAFAFGYRMGAKTVASTATTAGAASAATAKSAARQYPILATVLLAVAARDIWRLIPTWFKKNIPYLGRKARLEVSLADSQDDLTSLSTISMKLRSLFQRGREKLSSGSEIENPAFVFLATIRLMSQVKAQLAERRDKTYEHSGTQIQNPRDVLEGMDEAFEFADWAYNEFEEGNSLKQSLEEKTFSLLRHETTALPGHVAHYVAVSPEKKVVLIGIKGTSNFEDMLTDCCGNVVTHRFEEGPFVDGGREEIRCHEGVLLSSKRLADDLRTFIEYMILPTTYRVLITGHSLGAGVAVIFSMILRSRIESLRKDQGKKLKVLAFASPPILDYEASMNCKSFVTTYVNNADIIPRASLSNLVLLMNFMRTVHSRLDEQGLSPRGFQSTASFLKMLISGGKDGEMIMSPQEIREAVDNALDLVDIQDPDHLYVGGRVIHMYDLWTKENYGDRSDYENVGDDFDISKKIPTAERVYESDGTSRALRLIEIDDRMMSDHMSPGYRASIRSLLEKSSKSSKCMEDVTEMRRQSADVQPSSMGKELL